jgi:hypothetical protein
MLDDSCQDVLGTNYFASFASWRSSATAWMALSSHSIFALKKAAGG